MSRYKVYGTIEILVSMIVEADDEEAAIEIANEDFDGLQDYAGNGRVGGALVGTNNSNVTIHSDSGIAPEFNEAEKIS